MNRYKTFKSKYDYQKYLWVYYLASKRSMANIGEHLGIKAPAVACILHGCGGLNAERIFLLCAILDMNIVEWACNSDYVWERVKGKLTPYANSIVCRYRGLKYDDTVSGAIMSSEIKNCGPKDENFC